MRTFIRTTITWLVVAFVGDTILGPLIDINGVAPDFSVIALVILALATGAGSATVGGFMLGLVQDLSNPSLLGLQALCKSGLGFGVGSLRGRLLYGVPLVEGLVVSLRGANARDVIIGIDTCGSVLSLKLEYEVMVHYCPVLSALQTKLRTRFPPL